MAREDPQLKLRLTEEMKDHITKAAKANNRSVNAEIVARLQIAMDADRLEWNEDNALVQATKSLEDAAKETRYQTEVLKWMHEQQSASIRLLEAVAATDGPLKPEFLDALRTMLANRGSEPGTFPKHPDGDD